MNKKRLSVVMAGAMLASSVAPVLAAEVQKSEVAENNKGVLVKELTDAIWDAKRFSSLDDGRVASNLKGASVYGLAIDGVLQTDLFAKTVEANNVKSDLQAAIKTKIEALAVGQKVELVNLGSEEVTEEEKTLVLSTVTKSKFTENEIKGGANDEGSIAYIINKLHTDVATKTNFDDVVDMSGTGYKSETGEFIIKFKSDLTNYELNGKELVIDTDTNRLDFEHYYTDVDKTTKADFESAVTKTNFYGFAKATVEQSYKDIPNVVEKEYTITANNITYDLSELYDGVMLNEKGQELLGLVKDSASVVSSIKAIDKDTSMTSAGELDTTSTANEAAIKNIVRFVDANANPTDTTASANAKDTATNFKTTLVPDKNGVYKVRVDIANAYTVAKSIAATGTTNQWTVKSSDYDTFYITSDSRAKLEKILTWINNGSANVDVLAGEDRYETAVEIAKEVVGIKSASHHIVLVNGDSLVDGLAAAPLAHSLEANTPILLTETNSLPKATRTYLQELVDQQINKDITVHIVGGDGVVSNSIVKELKNMNLKVERLSGSDRQETSLAVAEKIADLKVATGGYKDAFVVGAVGEADAMSISGYAASIDAPIIVSGFEGLSEESIDAIDGKNVDVIGGDGVVSESDFKAVKSVAKLSRRISGEDRKATNAAVINTYYKDLAGSKIDIKSVIVAKDDVLVDALTASNLSVADNAPIVLGTKSLSDAQVNAVVNNAKGNAEKVYQVGHGVDTQNVVKLVAQSLGLI